MRISNNPLYFGWGGNAPLPEPKAFLVKKPKQYKQNFAEEIAGRLTGEADEAPRFVVLTGKKAPKWFEGQDFSDGLGLQESLGDGKRTPLACFLEKVSKAFAVGLKGKTGQVKNSRVLYQPGYKVPVGIRTTTLNGPLHAFQFNAEQIRDHRFMQIADLRQFCRDKRISEEDLYSQVQSVGKKLKPEYEKEILKDYTVNINKTSASGEEVIVILNPNSGLAFRFAGNPQSYFKNGVRQFRSFELIP